MAHQQQKQALKRSILIYNTGGTFSCDYDENDKLSVKKGFVAKWVQDHNLLAQFSKKFEFDVVESVPSFDSSQSSVDTWNRLITEIQHQLLRKILKAEENIVKAYSNTYLGDVERARDLMNTIDELVNQQSEKTIRVDSVDVYEDKLQLIEELRSIDQELRTRLLDMKEKLRGVADQLSLVEIEELKRQAYSACIIIHGTDTLAYSGSVISFGIVHADIPFILTGSQFPLVFPNSDAPGNLYGSVLCATEMVKRGVEGKFVFFDKHLMRATRVRKVHTNSLDAFESVNCPPVGQVQGNQVQLLESFFRAAQVKNLAYFPVPHIMQFSPNVQMFRIHPVFDIQDFRLITRRDMSRIIILQTYGAGNVHRDIAREIDNDRWNTYFSCSECYNGICEDKYAAAVDSANCSSLHDMTPEAAVVKASFLMAKPLSSSSQYWDETTANPKLKIILRNKIPHLMTSTLRNRIFVGYHGSISSTLVKAVESVMNQEHKVEHDQWEHILDRADACVEYLNGALHKFNKHYHQTFDESVFGRIMLQCLEADDFMKHCSSLPNDFEKLLEPSVSKALISMYCDESSKYWEKVTKRHIYQIEMSIPAFGEIINFECSRSLDGHLHANF